MESDHDSNFSDTEILDSHSIKCRLHVNSFRYSRPHGRPLELALRLHFSDVRVNQNRDKSTSVESIKTLGGVLGVSKVPF